MTHTRRLLRENAKILMQLVKRLYSTDRSYSTAIEILEDASYQSDILGHHSDVKPYDTVPGPRCLPIIGNSWRFAPIIGKNHYIIVYPCISDILIYIGQYSTSELDKVMWCLYRDYGKIVKVAGIIGHPDLLFVFDGDIIQKVFKLEEEMPHRPSMPSLHYYKQQLRSNFFGESPGAVGV